MSVAAAIVDEAGRLLAIRRADNDDWEPPGGVLELDESIQAGLVREVEEETGLRVEPEALTGVYKNMSRGIVALVFRCRVLSREPRPTAEAIEVDWLTDEQLSHLMSEAYRARLLELEEGLGGDGPSATRSANFAGRHIRRRALTPTRAGSWFVARDPRAAVEVDLAASDQQLPELGATTLNARLHPRCGHPQLPCRVDLAHAAEFGERDRLSVGGWQLVEEGSQTRGDLPQSCLLVRLRRRRRIVTKVDACRLLATAGRAPVVVGDRVACDLMHPRAHRRRLLELAGMPVNSQHHLLEDVLRAIAITDSAGDEREQRRMEVLPDLRGIDHAWARRG